MISYYFTVPSSRLIIENATPAHRLLGTQGQDLTVSCKAEGGKPAPSVVIIIDEQTKANQIQTVQHTSTTINKSYDYKTIHISNVTLFEIFLLLLTLSVETSMYSKVDNIINVCITRKATIQNIL
jgi:hypothetical protein